MIKAEVICDSISEWDIRLTSLQTRMPRFLLAEFNTHGAIAKNARSTRAVPTKKLIEEVRTNPWVPLRWGSNNSGMQSNELITDPVIIAALEKDWIEGANEAADRAQKRFELGLHKQWAGRCLEPYMWVDSVISATDWANFFALRDHKDAQPEFELLAQEIRKAMEKSTPKLLKPGEWHLPYIKDNEHMFDYAEANDKYASKHDGHGLTLLEMMQRVSVARCARVSYAPFDGNGSIEKELERYELLVNSKPVHASPTEHQATPDIGVKRWIDGYKVLDFHNPDLHGRFTGWNQFRKMIPGNTVLDR